LLIKNILLEKFHFKENNITSLINQNATHTRLEKTIALLAKKINKNDFLYIHYCGHGSHTANDNKGRTRQHFTQAWVPFCAGNPLSTDNHCRDITGDELQLWLTPIFEKTSRVVLVSDSCHSTFVSKEKRRTSRLVPTTAAKGFPVINTGSKIRFAKTLCGLQIEAASTGEVACEAPFNGKIHGVFSWFWAETLRETPPEATWGDLFKRTSVLVSQYVKHQHPRIHGDVNKIPFRQHSKTLPPSNPRIPVCRVWTDRNKVRIKAGARNGVTIGSVFRLHNPKERERKKIPHLKIIKVSSFYSDALPSGTFNVGDLVTEGPLLKQKD
ncbi:MAG: hypothetical protein GY757_56665, partial [bacterium]|nr:hypothetical protein [bacterium]